MRHDEMPLRLDAQVLMEQAMQLGKRNSYTFPIGWRNGRADIRSNLRTTPAIGNVVLSVRWPSDRTNGAIVNVEIRCPIWDMPPRVLALAGHWTPNQTYRWKFLCPLKRKLVRTVYFDSATQFFVGRDALGRSSLFSGNKFERIFQRALDLEHQIENQINLSGTDNPALTTLNFLLNHAHNDLSLATTGMYDASYTGGLIDANKMLKKRAPLKRSQRPIYYHDKTGVLRRRQLASF